MDEKALQEAIKRVAGAVTGAHGELRRISGGIRGVLGVAPDVVKHVEALGKERGLLGADKKKIAVEVVLMLVPDAWCPDWALRPIVGWAVERAVAVLKKAKLGLR